MSQEPYEIAWSTSARQALGKVPEKVGTAALELIYGPLAANPHRLGKPLRLDLATIYSARRGDYRVLYRIDDQTRHVVIVTIEHRSTAYRPRG